MTGVSFEAEKTNGNQDYFRPITDEDLIWYYFFVYLAFLLSCPSVPRRSW